MKIILAIDSFKGCMTSAEVEHVVSSAISKQHRQCDVVEIPVSDGGEGMLDAFCSAIGGHSQIVKVHDPVMRVIPSRYCISEDGQTAIIEMAQASGLTLLSQDEYNPMLTTSFGTGELILHALSQGAKRFVIGLGGSATCDAGTGMLQALGVKFMDCNGQMIQDHGGRILQRIHSVDMSEFIFTQEGGNASEFIVASDVTNPLFGPDGSAYVFAPQKGADAQMVELLDNGLRVFSGIVKACMNIDLNVPSAGSAGGMGAALTGFLNAHVRSGISLLLDMINFDRQLSDAGLVITGEGSADRQTLMGKLPYGILCAAKRKGVPVILLAGKVDNCQLLHDAGFTEIIQVTPQEMPLSQAIQKSQASVNIDAAIVKSHLIESMVKY